MIYGTCMWPAICLMPSGSQFSSFPAYHPTEHNPEWTEISIIWIRMELETLAALPLHLANAYNGASKLCP